ncbi:hypothetical protein E4V01_08165 [Methylorubrum sp. Q1]|uniref:hypothetical protein n=1 Tax=Methylorubrum sp. Q1 TaxID=2562453 RepID=UPI001075FE36|nr:hypothetical protein [Methylorubrum sp. Q1]TFZ59410.1 hypothetical protein E4V01_08165 [Methylorubrum sp. Q1]
MVRTIRIAAVLWAGLCVSAAPVPCLAEAWPRVTFQNNCPFALGTSFQKWSKGEVLPFVLYGAYLFKSPNELSAWIDVYSQKDTRIFLENIPESTRVSREKYSNFMDRAQIIELKSGVDVVPLEDMLFGPCPGTVQGLVRHPLYGDVYLVYLGRF